MKNLLLHHRQHQQRYYSLKAGFVGLPNVGKSTLFNALGTGQKARAENFPFCTIDPNVGSVFVPDERLDAIAKISKPVKITPTTMKFVDIAGLVKGASQGEGLGNKFLSNIKEVDAILHVVRCFESERVANVNESVDPIRDIEVINLELVIKDLEQVEKAIAKAQRGKGGNSADPNAAIERLDFLMKLKQHLGEGKLGNAFVPNVRKESQTIQTLLKEMQLLTIKPMVFVANISENSAENLNHSERMIEYVRKTFKNVPVVKCSAEVEAQIAEVQDVGERKDLLESIGKSNGESSLQQLVKASYASMGIGTFFTEGPDEVRSWSFVLGSKAPEAAAVIHSDFETNFIKAEVISYQDFVSGKNNRKPRLEGKDYIVNEGDIIVFKLKR